jgi:hypothetical protein
MSQFDLTINEKNKQDLLVAAKWAKVLAIFGYVGMGFMILAGIGMLIGGGAMASSAASAGMPFGALSLFYFLLAAFYYLPVTYMYRMAKNLKDAVNDSTQTSLDLGISYLAKFFKFSGYMIVGMIVLYVVVIIGVLVMTLI